jgi:hypothetical protein
MPVSAFRQGSLAGPASCGHAPVETSDRSGPQPSSGPPGPGLTDSALWLRSRECGENTIRDRLDRLEVFIRSHPTFTRRQPHAGHGWIARPGNGVWTRASCFGHLHSHLDYATENGIISVNLLARMRRLVLPKVSPEPLPRADLVVGAAPNVNMQRVAETCRVRRVEPTKSRKSALSTWTRTTSTCSAKVASRRISPPTRRSGFWRRSARETDGGSHRDPHPST